MADHFLSAIPSLARHERLLEQIQKEDAGIIILQEVTQAFWEFLKQQTYIQQFFSSIQNIKKNKELHILILSKWNFKLKQYRFSNYKRFPIATWQLNGKALHIAAVHLSSNQTINAPEIRKRQLTDLLNYLQKQDGDFILAGDFNLRGKEQIELMAKHQLSDLWILKHPNQVAYTFDIQQNPLAERMSSSKVSGRLDRALSNPCFLQNWSVELAQLFANQTNLNGEFDSDHFGLSFTFGINPKDQQLVFVENLIIEACTEILGQASNLYTIGSEALGTREPQSDIDYICPIPLEWRIEKFLIELNQLLHDLGIITRLILEAKVPILAIEMDGFSIDILVFQQKDTLLSLQLLPTLNAGNYDELSWKIVSAYLEMSVILEQVQPDVDEFRTAVRWIKHWAKQRSISGNAFSYLSSYSWTILVTFSLKEYQLLHTDFELNDFLQFFFIQWSTWDWSQAVCLNKEAEIQDFEVQTTKMYITTTLSPFFNSARNITQSTKNRLLQEFNRAANLIQNKQFSQLVDTYKISDTTQQFSIGLKPEISTKSEAKRYYGRLKGQLMSLLLAIEQQFDVAIYCVIQNTKKYQFTLVIDDDKNRTSPIYTDFIKALPFWLPLYYLE